MRWNEDDEYIIFEDSFNYSPIEMAVMIQGEIDNLSSFLGVELEVVSINEQIHELDEGIKQYKVRYKLKNDE